MHAERPDSLYRVLTQVARLHFYKVHGLMEPLGIHPGQPPLLFTLARQEGMSQKELARKLHIQPATLTVMLRRMEKNGWVRREQDAEDQRVSRVYLTEKGKDLCAEARSRTQVMEDVLFAGFPEEDLQELRRLMLRVRENLLREVDEPSGE